MEHTNRCQQVKRTELKEEEILQGRKNKRVEKWLRSVDKQRREASKEQTKETSHLEHVATHTSSAKNKTKIFKCRQCEFVAITKYEYWEHSRKHIKPEKMLTCTQCPFVTRYKHHLEYHMKNHTGAKPFKCDRCSYSCVNNSMLISHQKSHLNIYQYRCADCAFVSKYHHTLKIHLKKHNHKPAVILREDGTPDPIKFIDIHGRSRGPRKSSNTMRKRKVVRKKNIEETNAIPSMVAHTQISSASSLVSSMDSTIAGTITNGLVNDVTNGTNVSDQLSVMVNSSTITPALQSQLPEEESSKILSQMDINTSGSPDSYKDIVIEDQHTSNKEKGSSRRKGKPCKLNRQIIASEDESVDSHRTKGSSFYEVSVISENQYNNWEDLINDSSNYRSIENQIEDNEQTEPIDYSIRNNPPANSPSNSIESSLNAYPSSLLICTYCDIVFLHEIMYLVHMGYHGQENPYHCAKCCYQANDKVTFYLHIFSPNHN
ncbi:hypothetical protein M0802_000208 [Mischocyttarus mexicanus]|nr:hypothetical protein M0802_000208 [Mischocyttarus mexicanus]